MDEPKKKIIDLTVRAIAFFIGFGLFIYGAINLMSEKDSAPKKTTISYDQQQADLYKKDRKILINDEKAKPHELYGALMRLAKRGDTTAKQVAIKRRNDPSTLIRRGSAGALGYFDDSEAFSYLSEIIKDPDSNVRLQALKALSEKSSPARLKKVHQILSTSNNNLSSFEKIEVYSSLYKLEEAPEGKIKWLDAMINLSKETTTKGKDSKSMASIESDEIQIRIITRVLSLSPRSEKVLEFLREQLRTSSKPRILSLSIRHLSTLNDEWLTKNFEPFLFHEHPQIRKSSIESLHLLCLDKRWSLLEKLVNEELDHIRSSDDQKKRKRKFSFQSHQQTLLSALKAPKSLAGQEALPFINRMIASGNFEGQYLAILEKTKETISNTRLIDKCIKYKVKRTVKNK